ncbi:hypothetical protein ASPWEDRAFT_24048 [Aspergillus wentii DTO 134E9]|uniref:Cytochrome P450 monooxygenase n=1 Tax=Aspergillus wentii DTO 134E9 TaxID=1073089 RepID=A0A1L9RT25_ASPWE|nr:uncharacterized protein ASPWEDRAFT_24048 [Aspergillus wentii DTO 134E9]OJJ38075.1 hypothetical protein ASPWEDRAFT_24048 [Aspergillus wentii DTO 134E9]
MLAEIASYLSRSEAISTTGALILVTVFLSLLSPSPKTTLPLINRRKWFEVGYTQAGKRYAKDACRLIQAGLAKSPVFAIITDNGPRTVLASEYATEIRSHPALSTTGQIEKDFHTHIPAFEPFQQITNEHRFVITPVYKQLTHNLAAMTQRLVDQASSTLQREWTDDPDWHEFTLRPSILSLISQLSARILMGEKLCGNPDWLRITTSYGAHVFRATWDLNLWPAFVRPWVARFLPSCRTTRQLIRTAREIITPIYRERRMATEAAIQAGQEPEQYDDAMQWMEECANGRPYDPAIAQLGFAFAAIGTTTDMLTQVLLDLCNRPETVAALRQEIITVVQQEGWTKAAMDHLNLMDSVLKESQRLKPLLIATMARLVTEDVQLSNGTVLSKGTSVLVSGQRMWDPTVYPDPETFDPYRFLKRRQIPGYETSSLAVSPSPEHLGFSFGNHACPGRFFAIHEVKIALCQILLKYDLKLAPGCQPQFFEQAVTRIASPTARIRVRRRKEDVSI